VTKIQIQTCWICGTVVSLKDRKIDKNGWPVHKGCNIAKVALEEGQSPLSGERARAAVPEWSQKIATFRNVQNLSQSEFAKRLGASTMAVSRWERGIQKVPANIYIRLGNLAGDPLCWYFWGCAGLRTVDVMRVLPSARQRLQDDRLPQLRLVHAGGKKKSSNTADFVAVPLLPVHAGAPGDGGDKVVDLEQVRPEATLAAPVAWCPNPKSTMCLRVRGNSMSPLILDGYIIAVDTVDVRHDKLVGNIVVAWNVDKGLIVSRLIRFDHTDALISDQRQYESISLAPESKWRIIGKVLWWIGKAG
jgi:phage repressor protein C with HTH and peptisase S24 domain/DNA-binding transcriptional regulator YiaG